MGAKLIPLKPQHLTLSGWWGSLGVSMLLAVGPIRRVGIPALIRLTSSAMPMTSSQKVIGLGIFSFFAVSRAQILIKKVAPKVVARSSLLSGSSPLYQRLLAPLCGLGI